MTPHEASDKKIALTAEYSRLSQELEDIQALKPKEWMELRKSCKSAAETERAWEATENGIKEMRLEMRMDRIEKEISSLNSYLRVSELEARNLI